jgi:Na+/H+-dicarboxylate symporter
VLVNVFQPGSASACLNVVAGGDTTAVAAIHAISKRLDMVLHPAPSVVDAMARGDILQVVVFLCCSSARAGRDGRADGLCSRCSSRSHVMFKVTSYVMVFAPVWCSRRRLDRRRTRLAISS